MIARDLLPNLDNYPVLSWTGFKWLLNQGVSIETLIGLTPLRTMRGVVADDGRFDEDPEGEMFLAFPEAEDVVFWQPRTGELATWNGRCFALGQASIDNPGTYSFDCHLNIFGDPLDWFRAGRDGCVVLDWSRAFDWLRDCPRIAVAEEVLSQFEKHMQPAHQPEVFVIPARRAAA